MKFFLFLIFASFTAFAQQASPLDTISKQKRIQLLELGRNSAIDLLSENTFKKFRTAFDVGQRNLQEGVYKLPDLKAGLENHRLKQIPLKVIDSLNITEFGEYILALYAKVFSEAELEGINLNFKSEDGKRVSNFMRKSYENSGNEVKDVFSSIFTDINAQKSFLNFHNKSDYVYNNLLIMLFQYIDDKTALYQKS